MLRTELVTGTVNMKKSLNKLQKADKRPYECRGCVCLKCGFVGSCHCARKDGRPIPSPCDNFLTNEPDNGKM